MFRWLKFQLVSRVRSDLKKRRSRKQSQERGWSGFWTIIQFYCFTASSCSTIAITVALWETTSTSCRYYLRHFEYYLCHWKIFDWRSMSKKGWNSGSSSVSMTHKDAINLHGEKLCRLWWRADALNIDCFSNPVLLLVNFNLWFFGGKNCFEEEASRAEEIQMREIQRWGKTGLTVSTLLSRHGMSHAACSKWSKGRQKRRSRA